MSRMLSVTAITVSSLALLASGWSMWQQHQLSSPQRVLHARGLVIADESGQPRVVLGAPVPPPSPPSSAPAARSTPMSGLLLLGPDGSERGSYASSDTGGEAMLTLDDASGTTEVFKVVANPDRGATLTVKHQNNTGATLTSWQGEPELMFIDDGGRSFYVRPGTPAAP